MANPTKKYERWGSVDSRHNQYLKANYQTKSNEEIANALGRTEDAVRKQLNKLNLKRPLKGDLRGPKIPKKRGRKKFRSFFTILDERLKLKRLNERISRNEAANEKKKEAEKKWSSKFMGSEKKVVIPERNFSDQIRVRVDNRTVVYASMGSDPEEVRQRYLNKHT